ncbi:NAD-glutamate dehydrogenase [Ramlibacter solisilvae]|uniref:NAD-glutamate dehydrogenase n=1 Tax=Ramlibacter tataouinensis TaxID=94132 RepID=A0A127JWL8_9BURK|nr:NAD-glutamate dehydrogenase domain-containing protein [Ramlibacter tataouinensis]AMO22432.1 NAD-glutamate dehydrogenase [Ramlibacter tataouinensis]
MNAPIPQLHKPVEAVLALAETKLDAARLKQVQAIAPEYFRRIDEQDLAERTPEDLLAALQMHLALGAAREPGQPRIRIFSPSAAEGGWNTRHSVIQIVNDDMPFLVDSTTLEINRQGLTLHLIVHPIFAVERDANGQLLEILPRAKSEKAPRESWMHIEIDRLIDEEQREALEAGITRVLADVRHSVRDWRPMLARLEIAIAELANPPATVPEAAVAEARAFLQWLADDHMTLLGYRQHDLVREGSDIGLRPVPGSGLGVLRDKRQDQLSASFSALPARARAVAAATLPMLVVTKSNTACTVHRAGYTDYVGIKRYNEAGEVTGEHRFLGLFTSTAYSARVLEVPLLRGKVQAVIDRAGFPPHGHLAKALVHVLETFPRDDLFQIPEAELYDTALGIVGLGERQRLRLFAWSDTFERYVSCLVYVPRDAYSTDLRIKFQRILLAAFKGASAEFDVSLTEQVLARIHFTVRTVPGDLPDYDVRAIERELAAAARRWDDDLRDALIDAETEGAGLAAFKRWGAAFPAGYRERFAAAEALPDVRKLSGLSAQQPLALALYQRSGAGPGSLALKVYRLGAPLVLSDSLPMLEHMGVRVLGESSWRIVPRAGEQPVALHEFDLQAPLTGEIDLPTLAALFEHAFARVLHGEVESDDFNRLVLLAGLPAEDVVVLRAYAKYCKQIGFAHTQATIAATLAAYPHMARMLVSLYKLRFDPAGRNAEGAASQVRAIEQALEKVASLTDDRVLRQLLGLVQATLRTNFWRTGTGHSGAAGPRRQFLSFKFECAAVPGLPAPKPLYEIFVYSPRFEGVHLRGGKVARGGLRWSDRPDDFRTEVLGLVKAQMVKNTVIVPVGSKGGFVLKKAPVASDREAFMKEGVACYQDYLRGLLDLTDNLVAGKVVAPPQVVRQDDDDPYLVVAADKGTATFSDFANQVSAEYGHWLGDAFASGGSVGYDHKGMGITARGAWESVKRHFRELGVDTQTTDFTVVGVGDMSGDVFGNGMLLSRHIRLVAAFDHRHVFIDPAPDAAASFAERERLFKLPRSSWADYDAKLISEGGGIWSRSEKSIPLSPQARAALGIEAATLTPAELVSAILKAPVDLLYNGGIGTYVKCSDESHLDVGDRANDAVRIDGRQLRCKVVGEGGNLGFTQCGRIEAAQSGVRLYTDAIDNSAGVDTSDHEVNIKILLRLVEEDGKLTLAERNALLPTMTDEVAKLVLRDNYYQTQSLSVARQLAPAMLDEHARFMRFLEKKGRLDRGLEFLPGDDEIALRKAKALGLTTPELAVLLAYGKMWLYDELLASELPDDTWVATALQRYFPTALVGGFAAWIGKHPLRREIIATHVVNSMVNRVGPTFAFQLAELTGAQPAQVVRGYLLARESFGSVQLWQQIEALDNRAPDEVQRELIVQWRQLVGRATTWFLRSRRLAEPMDKPVQRLAPAVDALRRRLAPQLADQPRVLAWTGAGVPAELAQHVGAADRLFSALDIAEIAESAQAPLEITAEVHFGVGERLGLEKLRQQIELLPADTHWQSLAKVALADDLAALHRSIALDAVRGEGSGADDKLAGWQSRNPMAFARARRLVAELADTAAPDLAMLSVALRELRNLVD